MIYLKLAHDTSSKRIDLKQPIPFVPSPKDVADAMIEMVQPKPYERLYDLGCGDGRIPLAAARFYGCVGVGFESNLGLVEYARRKAALTNLGEGRVEIIHGNLFQTDLSKANIVTLYLTPEALRILRPRLEMTLPTGARVVSHNYSIEGWKPKAVEDVLSRTDDRTHRLFLYKLP